MVHNIVIRPITKNPILVYINQQKSMGGLHHKLFTLDAKPCNTKSLWIKVQIIPNLTDLSLGHTQPIHHTSFTKNGPQYFD